MVEQTRWQIHHHFISSGTPPVSTKSIRLGSCNAEREHFTYWGCARGTIFVSTPYNKLCLLLVITLLLRDSEFQPGRYEHAETSSEITLWRSFYWLIISLMVTLCYLTVNPMYYNFPVLRRKTKFPLGLWNLCEWWLVTEWNESRAIKNCLKCILIFIKAHYVKEKHSEYHMALADYSKECNEHTSSPF